MTQPPVPAPTPAERMRHLADTRQRVLSLPATQALRTILEHPQPAALVHSFPEEDLHFLIHDIGPDDALPLIALASNRQWEYLLDMEAWNKDQLDYPLTTTWLHLLLRADPRRLAAWCLDEKLDFAELYLFRNIEVRLREGDQSASDLGDGFFTDDDTFYVRLVDYPVVTPEEEALKTLRNTLLSQLLRRLSLVDHVRYQGLLMEAAGVIPAESEEEQFRLRNVRLGEKGFLPFHEAVGIYQPLRPEKLPSARKKVLRERFRDDPVYPVPQFANTFLEADTLFVRALKVIPEPPIIDQLQVELASLCNRIISADQKIIRGRHELAAVIAKANAYLSIGLEQLTARTAGSQESAAAALLQRHLLEDIFRSGFGAALQLHWDATKWRRESWWQANRIGLSFWEEKGMGLLGGLLLERPRHYDPTLRDSSYRDFRTLAEIEAAQAHLARLIDLDRLFKAFDIPFSSASGIGFLSYKNLLLTLWARAWLQMSPAVAAPSKLAIPIDRFRSFFDALWTESEGDSRRLIDDERKQAFLQWLESVSNIPVKTLSDRLGGVFEGLFGEVENELGVVASGNLDPRHVHLFLLKL